MKNLYRESLTKACVLTVLLAAGVCAVMLLPTSDELVERPGRQLYIPRYLFEKEIRGPTYHVVHRVLENDGYRSPVRTGVSQGQKTPHGKFLIRRRRALQAEDEIQIGSEGSVQKPGSTVVGSGMRIVPAYRRPHTQSGK